MSLLLETKAAMGYARLMESHIAVLKDNARLREALKQALNVLQVPIVSCQKGVIQICKCRKCVIERGDAALAAANAVNAEQATESAGWKMVPVEPTPEIIAAAAIAVWPVASKEDIELARSAAPIVLMYSDLGPGFTVESLAATLATMAPAYRAMVAAAPEFTNG